MVRKILIKKGASVSSIMLGITLSIFIFIACFNFLQVNANQAGVNIPSQYVESYNTIDSTTTRITDFTNDFKEAGQSIQEGTLLTAGYFGLKGVLSVMLLPFNLIDIMSSGFQAFSNAVGYSLSPTITKFLSILLTIVGVVAAVTVMTNRGREI